MSGACGNSSFDSHRLNSHCSASILRHRAFYCCCCVDCALAAFGFFGQHVATKGAAAGKFASACHLDALGSTLMGLEFWHLFTPYYDTQIASSHLRLLFDNCFIFKEANDSFNQLVSNLFMGHLASFVDYL